MSALQIRIRTKGAVQPHGFVPHADILCEDGRVLAVEPWPRGGPAPTPEMPGTTFHDYREFVAVPGFIDAHWHGALGKVLAEADDEQADRIYRFLASKGVTGCLPTLAASSEEVMHETARRIARHMELAKKEPWPEILGLHLEGPYLNPEKAGAQDPKQMRPPSWPEMQRLLDAYPGVVRLMTIAPELDGALELIQRLSDLGMILSIGHTKAGYEETLRAIDAGARRATHTFNGMEGLHHREPGATGAVLGDDRVVAELTLDGVHVHPGAARVLLKAKTAAGVTLITDSMEATGLTDGIYRRANGQEVHVRDGIARLPSGSLAGSVLTLDKAFRNVLELLGEDLITAVQLASATAARSLGLERKGRIAPGADADIVLLDSSYRIAATFRQGRLVYRNDSILPAQTQRG